MITFVDSVNQIDDYVTVRAVVEDSALVYSGSYYAPPEYGPSMCEASFYLSDDETLPKNENFLIEYLEKLELDWTSLPKDWDY